MGFKNDFSQAQQGGLKPEGDYEVIIVKAAEKTTKNGKVYLNLSMVIRNDVEQAYKNGYLFMSLFKRKEPTAADLQVNGYGFSQIMALGKAAQLPDGKDYENLEAFLKELVDKPIRAHLKHGEYNGEKREEINYINPTNFPQVRHVMKASSNKADVYASQAPAQYAGTSAPGAGFREMNDLTDEDLPF